MSQEEPLRLYTVQEARNLIARLRPLLAAMQVEQRRLQDEIQKLKELTPAMRQNGHATVAAEHEKLIIELGESIRSKLDEFEELDIEVKDIAAGVVDFPSWRDGRVVYLCWQIDEQTITHWHELDAGFMGRQPLDE